MKPRPEQGKQDWGENLRPILGVVITILGFLVQVGITTIMLMADGFATVWKDGKKGGR